MIKIVIHDYAGHPFQIDLSKQLAKNGFSVTHIYTTSSGGPKAGFDIELDNLTIINIKSADVAKQNFVKRRAQEVAYGKKLIEQISKIKPDIVISANTPLDAQSILYKWCKNNQVKFIFWLQDINSIAAESILKKKFGVLGTIVAKYYQSIEKKILRNSDHVITIAEDFNSIVKDWGVKPDRIVAIPNWAPIEEIPVNQKSNEFSRSQNLENKFVVLYSGTMGMKHNPDIIYRAAEKLKSNSEILFLVITQGQGRDYLENKMQERNLSNIRLLDFQPFEIFPQVLGSSDCTLTLLEPEAGIFSVPSKVWSSYCAARACVLVVPEENLSAKITTEVNAGVVVPPDSPDILANKITHLYESQVLCKELGVNARKYAEEHFHVSEIAKRFEEIIIKLNN